MEAEIIGYVLAILIGISLGLVGSGGSILTLPILVYLMGVEPVLATAYSLFIVGVTSFVGGIKNAFLRRIDFRSVIIFGLPSVLAVYFSRAFLLPLIPDVLFRIDSLVFTKSMGLMVLFAIVMILASVSMLSPKKKYQENEDTEIRYNYPMILSEGIVVGVLTGLVGAGGGFLVIPALVLLAKMPIKLAIGTSLFIIAIKSILGFIGDLQNYSEIIDWKLLLIFSFLSVLGIFVGVFLSRKIDGTRLKSIFGWFVLVMGGYIFIKELFL